MIKLLVLCPFIATLFNPFYIYAGNAILNKPQVVVPKNIVQGKNVLIPSMLNRANTTYIIQHDFNLEGATIDIPSGCTLLFKGGSLANGVITGHQTTLDGNVKVPFLKGTFTNKVLNSSIIRESNDYDKLKSLLSLGVEKIVLNEDFVIRKFEGTIISTSNVDGSNSTISLQTDLKVNNHYTSLLKFIGIQSFCNLIFNGNNHALLGVATFNNESNIDISNVCISNIDCSTIPISSPSYCNCLVVSLNNAAQIRIRRVVIKNIKSRANSIIGDSDGNITGIYIQAASKRLYYVYIDSCHFEELHNYKNGKIYFEDVSGVYVSQARPFNTNSQVYITNISGYNFGKRLIKTDSCHVIIDGIQAENYIPDVLTVIGLNDGNASSNEERPVHAEIRHVNFKGITNYVIASSVKNTIAENVKTEITDYVSVGGTSLCSVFTGNSFSSVRNVTMLGAHLLFHYANFKNELYKFKASQVEYDDTMYSHPSYGNFFLCTFNGHVTLNEVNIKTKFPLQLFADNYPTRLNVSESLQINNIRFESSGNYSAGVFTKSENALKKKFSIFLDNGTFIFHGSARWFMKAVFPDIIKLKNLNIYFKIPNPTSLCLSMDYKDGSELYLDNIHYELPSQSYDAFYLYNRTNKIVKCHASNICGNKNETTLDNVFIEGNFIPKCSVNQLSRFSQNERGMVIIDKDSNKLLVWNGVRWQFK